MKLMNFKNNFKKNEIVIYAIALMLVVAGYFNYTTNLSEIEVSDEITSSEVASEENTSSNIGDARLVNSNDIMKNDINTNENKDESTETNTQAENASPDYFVNTKLERDTEFASIISTYTKILEDNSISETQKSIAMTEITKINNNKNAISICENLLSTKGFLNSVVLVNKDNVNVVIKTDTNLTTAEVAQIQNVISREFSVPIENIHIMEKND